MRTTERIRRAISDAISDNPRNIKAAVIALQMGVSPGTVYKWGEETGVDIPLARFIQLGSITGDQRPISSLCELLEGAFLPVPPAKPGANLELKILKEFYEFAHALADAIEDGRITATEAARLRSLGTKAIRVIAQAIAEAERRVQEE